MGWHLAGKVTAVVGTHTHVQTADDQILPGGTAYITDVGMTGPHDGIIGVEREPVINRFLTGLPARFEAAEGHAQAARGRDHRRHDDRPGHVDRADQPDPRRARSDVGRRHVDSSERRCLRCSTTPSKTTDRRSRRANRPRAPAAAPRAGASPAGRCRSQPAPAPSTRSASSPRPSRAGSRRSFFQVWLEGEISNARPASLGPSLLHAQGRRRADQGGDVPLGNLRLPPLQARRRPARHRARPLEVYEARGEMQIVCRAPRAARARRAPARLRAAEARLEAEGLFAAARKRPLPLLPRTIGIVTSLDGAAVRDIVRVVTNRHAGLRLLIRPCRVQGEGAGDEVARAIRDVSRHPGVDVVIVGARRRLARGSVGLQRGGRSRAPSPPRRCRSSRGVGHEIDTTIADFAADVRAATPSNAAEIVVARRDELARRIAHLDHRARAAVAAARRGRAGRGARARHPPRAR